MKICRTATRIRRHSLVAMILIAALFVVPPQRVRGQSGSGEQAASLSDEQLDGLVGKLLVRALSIYARSGRDFWREASIAQNNLALLLGATGREHESETVHLDAIRLSIKAGGERNTDPGVFIRDLATLYTQQGRFEEADDLYRRSISILRDGLGESSHQLSKTYRAYSTMLSAAGRSREAAAYRRRADATGF